MPSCTMDIDDAAEGEGGWGGTTVGAVRGERGSDVDASCSNRRAWTLARRAAISQRSSTMMLGG